MNLEGSNTYVLLEPVIVASPTVRCEIRRSVVEGAAIDNSIRLQRQIFFVEYSELRADQLAFWNVRRCQTRICIHTAPEQC